MAEYIERERAMQIAFTSPFFSNALMEEIKAIPAADVAPVVHGHWEQVDDTKCRCSRCDIIALIGLYPHGDKNYCPNCGAKMDKEEHNG